MMQLWAGLECTVNRVRDRYFDQVVRTGHHRRLFDLELIESLGIKTLRYPILWERTMGLDGRLDWTWSDERLNKLRELQIDPIVGLLHHGSGPINTGLLDDSFADKFARYAGSVAGRYPWIERYTPINEPLTTARFSGLYGLWYPHSRSDNHFVRALLGQCRGTALAMREIRRVNPNAQLIQTEDLGKIFSTSRLDYQAEFENERRWLTFDLLSGRVDRHHPLWSYLLASGVDEREISWFRDNPCPPDIFGVNHYVTSDRFLDERLDLYPCSAHGGNGHDRYADVEAVRVDLALPCGVEYRLLEAWHRYRKPLAITEVHLGAGEDDQVLWFCDSWRAAERLVRKGVDLRAVTAWSLFGTYDWHCLVTREENRYECGVFDIRHDSPRETLLAHMLREIANGRAMFPVADWKAGWWRSTERIHYTIDETPHLNAPPAHLDLC